MFMLEIGQPRTENVNCVQKIDMDMIIKMFDNLPPKIIKSQISWLG